MLERVPDGKYSLLLVSCWEYCQSVFLPIMTAGKVWLIDNLVSCSHFVHDRPKFLMSKSLGLFRPAGRPVV